MCSMKTERKELWEAVAKAGGRKGNDTSIATLFADERIKEAVLEYIHTTDVGKMTEEAKIGNGPLASPWVGDAGHDKWLWSRLRELAVDGVS